jgi:serine protease inhibitor
MLMLKKWLNTSICAALTLSNLQGQLTLAANSEAASQKTTTIEDKAENMLPCQNFTFAIKLFTHEQTNENAVVSPFSAYSALSMAANGAHGKTRQDMANTLGFKTDEMDSVNRRNLQVMTVLQGQPDIVKLEIANAIFADHNYPFKDSFKAKCHEFYRAEAQSLDFNKAQTVATINDWCKEKTHGKIDKIIAKLTSDEKMVLLNTVYFKGKWATPFKKESTYQEQFHAGLKIPTNVSVDMMHIVENLPYLKESNFQAIAMPYKGLKQSLYVFLPNQNSDLKTMLASFSEANWKSWLNSFHNKNIELSLPKVKVKYSTELSTTLKQIGMASAFTPNADFSDMIEPPQSVFISKVVQKTFLGIDEAGTEAAAATAVIMAARAMAYQPQTPLPFKVDRPFVIALVDNDSQEILFLGAISNPQSK